MALWVLKYQKRNKSPYFFQCLLETLCHFNLFFLNLYVFPISYKCKYVLFHLNMFKLFQEIKQKKFFMIKLVSNKKISLKYIIQGFNSHLLN